MATNAQVTQGTLNRLLTSIIVPQFPALNITASYLASGFAQLSFEGQFSQLLGTATGAVTSPEPYVFGNIEVSLLKTQALGAAWLAQAGSNSSIGPVTGYADSAAFPAITLVDCVIQTGAPARYDGRDPTVNFTIHGVYYINSAMWSAL